MKRVDFYYDFSCPFAYLGSTQIEAVCTRAEAALVWRPFLLGALFKAIGTSQGGQPPMPGAKMRHNALDMMRWADHWSVPLKVPATHPNRTVLALRAALASGDLPRASKALFAAYWALGQDVSQPGVVREALDAAGLDGASAVQQAEQQGIKDELRRRTDEAIAAGVFGAPAFVVAAGDGPPALFWGQDRLLFVEKALAGWQAPDAPGQGPRS